MYDQNCEAWWAQSDFLPLDTVVNYWCSNNPNCREPKTHALLAALDRGNVKYQRSDGQTFEDPIYELYQRNLILVERESFITWSRSVSSEMEQQNLQNNLGVTPRSETTYLNIIGALLNLMLTQSPGGQRYSAFNNQAAIIDMLLSHHSGKPGISQRTLEAKFAEAKRQLTSY